MSRTTLANAKAELATLLGASPLTPTVTGVDLVYDYLPQRDVLTEPVSVAVYVDNITAVVWGIAVAVFVLMTDDERVAQGLLDTLLPAIDDKTNTGAFGPTNWQISYPTGRTNLEHYIATCVYEVGREDI